MEKIKPNKQHNRIWIPLFTIIWPWVFLILWIPPFTLIGATPLLWIDSWTGTSSADRFMDMELQLVHHHGILFFYVLLIAGMVFNLINAMQLASKKQFECAQSALLTLRIASIFTYPALVWGLPLSVLFLLGPKENEHILFLIFLSLPALNLSGAFYSVPLVLELKRKQKINVPDTIFYLIASFIVGLDIIGTFLMRRKWKA